MIKIQRVMNCKCLDTQMHIANWADHVNGASCSFLEVQEVSSVEKSFIRFKLLSS